MLTFGVSALNLQNSEDLKKSRKNLTHHDQFDKVRGGGLLLHAELLQDGCVGCEGGRQLVGEGRQVVPQAQEQALGRQQPRVVGDRHQRDALQLPLLRCVEPLQPQQAASHCPAETPADRHLASPPVRQARTSLISGPAIFPDNGQHGLYVREF